MNFLRKNRQAIVLIAGLVMIISQLFNHGVISKKMFIEESPIEKATNTLSSKATKLMVEMVKGSKIMFANIHSDRYIEDSVSKVFLRTRELRKLLSGIDVVNGVNKAVYLENFFNEYLETSLQDGKLDKADLNFEDYRKESQMVRNLFDQKMDQMEYLKDDELNTVLTKYRTQSNKVKIEYLVNSGLINETYITNETLVVPYGCIDKTFIELNRVHGNLPHIDKDMEDKLLHRVAPNMINTCMSTGDMTESLILSNGIINLNNQLIEEAKEADRLMGQRLEQDSARASEINANPDKEAIEASQFCSNENTLGSSEWSFCMAKMGFER